MIITTLLLPLGHIPFNFLCKYACRGLNECKVVFGNSIFSKEFFKDY
jgi:hypothetical protein